MHNASVMVWILGDQLLAVHPVLAHATAIHGKAAVRVVMIESLRRQHQLPYQRKKRVLILSAMRHYAAQLSADGYAVTYLQAESTTQGLSQAVAQHPPTHFYTMAASEYNGRQFQQDGRLAALVGCLLTVLPNTQFMVGTYDPYPETPPDKSVVMENFYRRMRVHFDMLMTADGQPVGGAWNFDKDNRKPLPKNPVVPNRTPYPPDDITQQVMAEVDADPHGVGTVAGFGYAVTHAQAQHALETFIAERLPHFGDYEDAMSQQHAVLWHSVLSPYLNLGLLTPLAVAHAAEQAYHAGTAPINAIEGFVRQVIGWREFMYWQYWRLMPRLLTDNAWDASRPMPLFFWDGGQTDMNCLHHTIKRATDSGYNHHIERLMLITNFCTLAGIQPQAVVRWMRAYYIDAYDWVMQTNVVGMGLNADGGIIATKPYIASANYIHKMSDFCGGCRYDRKQRHGKDACPFNTLYWNFLITHEARLRANPRFGKAVLGLRHLDNTERDAVQADAATFLEALQGYDDEA